MIFGQIYSNFFVPLAFKAWQINSFRSDQRMKKQTLDYTLYVFIFFLLHSLTRQIISYVSQCGMTHMKVKVSKTISWYHNDVFQ